VYHEFFTDTAGRIALLPGESHLVCNESPAATYPPPESFCNANEHLSAYFASPVGSVVSPGVGIAVCTARPLNRLFSR